MSKPPVTMYTGGLVVGVVVAVVVVLAPVYVAATAAPPPTTVRDVVVVAVPGLQWGDVSPTRTPNLWRFAQRAARGLLVVKSAGRVARCADAMTTLGAGNRATATNDINQRCPTRQSITAADWVTLRHVNRAQRFGTNPGALGDALAAHGLASDASGDAGAVLAAARSDGSLVPGPRGLRVVELGAIYRAAPATRAAAVAAVDEQLSSWLLARPDVLTIVAGAGDDGDGSVALRVALISGPGFGPGRLTSDSTGRAPYVELIDLAPTVLSALGVMTPSSMVGQPWRMASRHTSLVADAHHFVDANKHAVTRVAWGGRFLRVLVAAAAAACLLGAVLLLAGVRRARTARVAETLCYLVAGLPAASYALQFFAWWRWSGWLAGVVLGGVDVVLVVAADLAAARRRPWGGLGVLAGVTALLLAGDLLTGTHLQLDGLLGDATTVAGRFHGAGNTTFGVFAAGALLAAGWLAVVLARRDRRVALAGALALGAAALVLDGAPTLGDDLGGVIALAPAVAVLALLVLGVRLRMRVWLGIIAVGVVAGLALVGYDLAAGGGHIGRFAGQAGRSGARVTIDRKLAANLGSWHHSDYVASVGFALLAIAAAVRRGLRRALVGAELLGAAFVAVAVCAVIGGAVNDSGVVVPGAAAVLAVPLLLAGCLRAAR